jgi:hypothetical protein
MNDEYDYNLPTIWAQYGFVVVTVAAILWLLIFPMIAGLVAPNDRRWEFFFLTLFILWGPFGIACAAIANPRTTYDS